MNVIFTAVFLLSALVMTIFSPADFLPAMLGGVEKAVKTLFTLFCVYAVWLGISAVAEDAGLTGKVSRLLAKPCKKIFRTDDKEAVKAVAMNLSCNLLGVGGAATPFAVAAINAFERNNHYFAQNLLFIINATSVQLIPTTVITLLASYGSANPYSIFLPSLVATVVSTGCAVTLFLLSDKLKLRGARRVKCST